MADPQEEIFGTEGKPAEPANPDPVMETLKELKGSIETISTRLDDFDTRLTEATTPEEEETEEEHFKPKTWDEIPQKAEEIAINVVEAKFEERQAAEEAEKQAKIDQQKQIDSFIDAQTADLEKSGALPKVENPNDENDKGRAARRELFGFAAHIGTMDLTKASGVIEILHKSGYTYDPKANNMQGEFIRSGTTPSGINAPVGSSSRSAGGTGGKPDYKEISNLSMDALIRKAMPEYQ